MAMELFLMLKARLTHPKSIENFTLSPIDKLKGKLEFIINKKRFSVGVEYCQPVHGSDGYSYAEISASSRYLLEL